MANNSEEPTTDTGASAAADLVRQKISAIYEQIDRPADTNKPEPRATGQFSGQQISQPASKHQAYMQQLTDAGMSLAEIQAAWHKYYQDLNDTEKHQVWQEFYANQKNTGSLVSSSEVSANPNLIIPQPKKDQPRVILEPSLDYKQPDNTAHTTKSNKSAKDRKTISQLKKQLVDKAERRVRTKASKKEHFQSALFGVGLGSLVMLIMLFSFFNERFIAPFITPSRSVTSTPIIADSTAAVDATPKVIIPKINVEIPTVYDMPSIEESVIEQGLERGVVHYPTTPSPGEQGNAVVFGHSSNNILNKGQYKFAFVLLNKLETGDTFYLTKNKVRYSYRVYEKKIVKPTEVGVLDKTEKPATATLITCDPPGTSLNRLVVIGEQVSPDPAVNKTSTAVKSGANGNQQPSIIPSNAPSLWSRIVSIFR